MSKSSKVKHVDLGNSTYRILIPRNPLCWALRHTLPMEITSIHSCQVRAGHLVALVQGWSIPLSHVTYGHFATTMPNGYNFLRSCWVEALHCARAKAKARAKVVFFNAFIPKESTFVIKKVYNAALIWLGDPWFHLFHELNPVQCVYKYFKFNRFNKFF